MYPTDRRYSKDHEWIAVDGEVALVGITDFAQKELGDIVYVELPRNGQRVKAGDVLGTIESVKAVSEILAPVAGTVVDANQELDGKPEPRHRTRAIRYRSRSSISNRGGEPSGCPRRIRKRKKNRQRRAPCSPMVQLPRHGAERRYGPRALCAHQYLRLHRSRGHGPKGAWYRKGSVNSSQRTRTIAPPAPGVLNPWDNKKGQSLLALPFQSTTPKECVAGLQCIHCKPNRVI